MQFPPEQTELGDILAQSVQEPGAFPQELTVLSHTH
jgi:hypothetical protein